MEFRNLIGLAIARSVSKPSPGSPLTQDSEPPKPCQPRPGIRLSWQHSRGLRLSSTASTTFALWDNCLFARTDSLLRLSLRTKGGKCSNLTCPVGIDWQPNG
jgi:hypothetical protein